jgi:protein O-mannosyl-transferase
MLKRLTHFQKHLLCVAALILGVAFIYFQVHRHGYVEFDDQGYVFRNSVVLQGLTWNSVVWAWKAYCMANYHPLTMLSYMADVQVFGPSAGAMAAENAAFHLLAVLLIYQVGYRLSKRHDIAFLFAAVFGLHPLNVESVAWISQRKSVLAMFFGLAALDSYLHWVNRRQAVHLVMASASLLLSLLAKPLLVSFVPILLLLDEYPLRRFVPAADKVHWRHCPTFGEAVNFAYANSFLLLEKIPFAVVTFAACVATYIAQVAQGAVSSIELLGLSDRVMNASMAYFQYIVNFLYPTRLALLYPLRLDFTFLDALPSMFALTGMTVISICYRRRYPGLFVGWMWYVITFLPMIGLVQVGRQALADRYMYLPMIGLVFIGISLYSMLRPRLSMAIRQTIACALSLWLVFAANTARKQTYLWQNTFGIMGRTLEVVGEDVTVLASLAAAHLFQAGRPAEALMYLRPLANKDPDFPSIWTMFSVAHALLGQTDDAVATARQAMYVKPEAFSPRFAYCFLLRELGRMEEAEVHRKLLLKLFPEISATELDKMLEERGNHVRDALQEPSAVQLIRPHAS